MLYKASTSTNILITNKMATTTPLAIGTRGTIGSLVRREIEYFRRIELDRPETSKKLDSKKPQSSKCLGGSGARSKTSVAFPTLGSFLSMSWKKKRRSNNGNSSNNNSGRFLPSMCSAVDVCSESTRFGVTPGYSYRSLKTDINTD
ncbi:uncharacterized protein LOC141642608 [Silene latifolia]|uniref:uncharacterized protein LOC141642608 n=1 Tax=Silene latifolia TaxID=37657 RepID=UPI003D76BF9D